MSQENKELVCRWFEALSRHDAVSVSDMVTGGEDLRTAGPLPPQLGRRAIAARHARHSSGSSSPSSQPFTEVEEGAQ